MTGAAAQRPPHLVVGTPCYGGMVTSLYTTSLLHLQQACRDRGIGFDVLLLGGDALVTRARNFIATQFLHMETATHLMFIDADIGFSPEAVLRLLDFGADLSGGLYPSKQIDWDRARKVVEKGGDPRAGAMHYVAGLLPGVPRQGDFAPARLVGNGFMMIRRHVFSTLAERHPELRFRHVPTQPDPQADSPYRFAFFDGFIDERGMHLPEDYAFCRRWTDAGGEIWVDLASQLTHRGAYDFEGDSRYMLKIVP